MPWIPLALAAAGTVAGVVGANKQAKAVSAANATNDARLAQQDQSAWNAYLLSRGVNPAGSTTGQLPANAEAVNFKLPLYAKANFTVPGAQKTWRKKGSTIPVGTLARGTTSFQTDPSSNPYVMAAGSPDSGKSSFKNDLLIGNPLGIGGEDRSFLDPFGIF